MKFADLHIHTFFSDGTYSPQEAINEASSAGISCISITDHDSVEGIEAALNCSSDVEIIPGIELTAENAGAEVHILGYLVDYKQKVFLNMLKKMREIRVKRIYEICKKLKKLGVGLEPEEVFALAGSASVGRLHVARALYENGKVFSIPEAFNRYIGDKGPAYSGKFKMSPKEAIGWIKRAGGVPVLAHPYTLRENVLIDDFVKAGIMGIEVYYCQHSKYQTEEFLKIAQKNNLLITGGSDSHGSAKDSSSQIGNIKLPYEFVEKLKEAKCRIS